MWSDLSMKDRAKYIQMGISSGITDLSVIRDTYNRYAEGGLVHKYDGTAEKTQQMSKPFRLVTDKGEILGEFDTLRETRQYHLDNYRDAPIVAPTLDEVIVEGKRPTSKSAKAKDEDISDYERERYLHNLEKSGFNFDYADRVLKADRHARQYNAQNILGAPIKAVLGINNFIKDKIIGTGNYLFYERKPRIIPLNNNVQQLGPWDEADYILYNDFAEWNPNNIRKARDFKHTTDTLIGDRKIPLSNFSLFQGVVEDKLVVDSLKNFDDNITVVPVRSKNRGKIKELLPKRGNWVPAVTTTNDTIFLKDTNMTNKAVLGDEIGDSYFIENISKLNDSQFEYLNNILAKRPKYYVLPDGGRYMHTSENASVQSYVNPLTLGSDMFIIGKGKK